MNILYRKKHRKCRAFVFAAAFLLLFGMLTFSGPKKEPFGMAGLQQVQADSMVIVSAASAELRVGENLAVYLIFSSTDPIRGVYANITYDPNVLRYTGGDATGDTGSLVISDMRSEDFKEFNYVLNFETLMIGETDVSIADSGLYNSEAVKIASPTDGTHITVSDTGYLSDNNTLGALSASYGTLEPEFDPNITFYTLNVPHEINAVSIFAETADPSASTTMYGAVDLAEGENVRTIVVAAENGTTREYTVVIRREALSEDSSQEESREESSYYYEVSREDIFVSMKVNGITLYMKSVPSEAAIPAGFSMVMFPYQGVGFDIVQSQDGALKLFYLADYRGEDGAFYWYNAEKDECEDCIPILAGGKPYLVFDSVKLTEVPENYSEVAIRLGDRQITAFAKNGSSSLTAYVVSAIGEEGKKTFYNYDTKAKTMSLYNGPLGQAYNPNEVSHEDSESIPENSAPAEESGKENSQYTIHSDNGLLNGMSETLNRMLPYLILGFALLLLIIIILIMLISRSIRRNRQERSGGDIFDDSFVMAGNVTLTPDPQEPEMKQGAERAYTVPEVRVSQSTTRIPGSRSEKVPQSWKESTTKVPVVKMNEIHSASIDEVTRQIPKVLAETGRLPQSKPAASPKRRWMNGRPDATTQSIPKMKDPQSLDPKDFFE